MTLNYDIKSVKSRGGVLIMISFVILVSLPILKVVYAEILMQDSNLKVELVTTGLNFPTGMAFLGKNDILVAEKDGKVKRIVGNESIGQTLLDITPIVDDRTERGLLGVAVSHDAKDENVDGNNKNGRNENELRIYLLYTTNSSEVISSCISDICRNNYAVNILHKLVFKDGYLVDETKLLEIPFDEGDPAFGHIGGAIIVGPDNNIYIPTGDGNPCFDYKDCKFHVTGGSLNYLTANSKNGRPPNGAGGILRVTQNGDPVGEGILGDQYPLNLYYAYGIRNSFGIDFDPVTGKLWDTENGPYYGDEINLVEPGFNSGWTKIQGVWPIRNYSEMAINEPIYSLRGHNLQYFDTINEHETMVDFNGNGKYSQPEFTWNKSIGVTSIKFFNSNKLGKGYENDLFVGSNNAGGWIYHFDLSKDRKNLKLQGVLNDKVANNKTELNDVFFAKGFGSITDLEVGPDGYLYVLSIGNGAIYKITPKFTKIY